MAVTIVTGITATQNETGATFTGGAITNSTIDNSPIGGVTPSTGSFTTVSAQTGVFTGDVRVSGKVTVGQAVSAASFNATGIVSAGGDVNAAGNLVAGARTVVVSGDAGRVNATLGAFSSIVSAAEINSTGTLVAGARSVVVSGDSGNITAGGKVDITGAVSAASGHFTGVVSAASINVTGDINAVTGAVLASAATFTASVTANSLHVNTIISAAGTINTTTNFVAGARTVVVSGDTGSITCTNLTVTSANLGTLPIISQRTSSWSPTFTGVTSQPSITGATYIKTGKSCTLFLETGTNVTSNATTFTITSAPFTAAGTKGIGAGWGADAGVNTGIIAEIAAGGTTIILTKGNSVGNGNNWTAASNKGCSVLQLTYQTT